MTARRLFRAWLNLEALQIAFTLGAIFGMAAMAIVLTSAKVLVLLLKARGVL